MFKKFLQRIIDSKDQYDAMQNVFYGTKWDDNGNVIEYGIDIAYQHEKITWKQHQMLLGIISKMK